MSRTTVTAAFAQLRDDGYLHARRGARSTTALPAAGPIPTEATTPTVSLAEAAMAAPGTAVLEAFADAARDIAPYLREPGHEVMGVVPLRAAAGMQVAVVA
ncbi:hypothetical protein A5699_03710 [Mycobacterium sp. E802]|nr:hypothetical protein A5699_03710 [Mycobacterium sp. E802]